MTILTPETSPDHHVVGRYFKAHDGRIYYCDSYDTTQGYWMTGVSFDRRTNVSERAIDATFHTVRKNSETGKYRCTYGYLNPEDTAVIDEHRRSL